MKITFVFTASPHSGARAQEGLDALLMGSAFAECSAVFLDEAVWQLIPNQAPEAIGHKNFSLGFAALNDYGVSTLLCSSESLDAARLSADDLMIPVTPASAADIRAHLDEADQVLMF